MSEWLLFFSFFSAFSLKHALLEQPVLLPRPFGLARLCSLSQLSIWIGVFFLLALHVRNSHPEGDAPDSLIEAEYLLSKTNEPISTLTHWGRISPFKDQWAYFHTFKYTSTLVVYLLTCSILCSYTASLLFICVCVVVNKISISAVFDNCPANTSG